MPICHGHPAEAAMWEMAKSADLAQQAYGELYAEQQAQADVGGAASISFIGRGGFDSEGRLGGKIAIETDRNGDRALALTSALQKIAAIEPSDRSDTRTWGELASVAVRTAREAVAGFERVEEGEVIQALLKIAEMDPGGGQDARRSCKEVTETAVKMAHTALDAISQGANVGTDVAMGAAETMRDSHSNERTPAQGMSW